MDNETAEQSEAYYRILEKCDDTGNLMVREDGRPARVPFMRWANVFNLDQTEGIEAAQNAGQPLEKATAVVEKAKLCPIHHAGFAAVYSPNPSKTFIFIASSRLMLKHPAR